MYKKQKIKKSEKEFLTPYYDGIYNVTINSKKELIDFIINEYNKTMNSSNELYKNGNSNNGGLIRSCNGQFVEEVMKLILITLCRINKIENYQIYKGSKKPLVVRSKNGHVNISVDVHSNILFNDKMKNLFHECKLNLDQTYITRANSNFSYIKKENKKNHTHIFALQTALNSSTQTFFEDQKNINKISYAMDSRRNAQKPIWREDFFQNLNEKKLMQLINYTEKRILY